MKTLGFLSLMILGMMLMSFTITKNRKPFVQETESGAVLINVDLLSLDDLAKLEAMTVTGAAETTAVHKKIYKEVVSETVWKHKDQKLQDQQLLEINEILTKY
jgi:hypothetical protein